MKNEATDCFSATPLLPIFEPSQPSQQQGSTATVLEQRGEPSGAQETGIAGAEEVCQRSLLDVVMVILSEAMALMDDSDDECIHLQQDATKKPTTRGAMMSSTSRPPKE
jgi:hypothetical protein